MDFYRGATGVVAGAGPVLETVGAVVVPEDGETARVHSVMLSSNLAGAAATIVEVRESVNNGVAFTALYRLRLEAAGTIQADNERFLFKGENHQPPGGSVAGNVDQVQYQLAVTPGTAADVYSASMAGRTGRG